MDLLSKDIQYLIDKYHYSYLYNICLEEMKIYIRRKQKNYLVDFDMKTLLKHLQHLDDLVICDFCSKPLCNQCDILEIVKLDIGICCLGCDTIKLKYLMCQF